MRAVIFIFFIFSFRLFALSQEPDAKSIVKAAYDKMNGLSSQSEMSMTLIRPSWSRTISMKSWNKGNDYSLVLITAPAKEKGQVFLKRKTEMWNWVPKINRMIKLPPSMMMQAWMGSDFTNDDLVKMSSIVNDYNHKIISRDKYYDHDCYIIELRPIEDAAVVWGKIKIWVAVKEKYILKSEYYDEDFDLVNIEEFTEIKLVDNRKIPTKYIIIPKDKPGNKTVLIIKSIDFDIKISESFFSQQNMKRIK